MTFDDLYWLFCSWGFMVKPEYYYRFRVYFNEMTKRHRVILIHDDDNSIVAVITFFITNNHEELANKPEFACPPDSQDGPEIYIDKMVCAKFTLPIIRAIHQAVYQSFPNVKVGFWHREPNNRCVVTYKRRIKHASQDTK